MAVLRSVVALACLATFLSGCFQPVAESDALLASQEAPPLPPVDALAPLGSSGSSGGDGDMSRAIDCRFTSARQYGAEQDGSAGEVDDSGHARDYSEDEDVPLIGTPVHVGDRDLVRYEFLLSMSPDSNPSDRFDRFWVTPSGEGIEVVDGETEMHAPFDEYIDSEGRKIAVLEFEVEFTAAGQMGFQGYYDVPWMDEYEGDEEYQYPYCGNTGYAVYEAS